MTRTVPNRVVKVNDETAEDKTVRLITITYIIMFALIKIKLRNVYIMFKFESNDESFDSNNDSEP